MGYLVIALGGATGAVLRWSLSEAVPPGSGFPWATFLVNVTGSFALGALPAWRMVRRRRLLALGVGPGLLGGYTTLSAYAEETRALLGDGATATALVYLLGTLTACVTAAGLAARLSSRAADDELVAEGGGR